MASNYVVGIDLGTTNCVLGYAPLDTDRPHVQLLRIPQLTSAHTVEQRDALPSFVYLGSEPECTATSVSTYLGPSSVILLSGNTHGGRGRNAPTRTVAAAKSWLCHSRVDRRENILPWNARTR